MVSCHPVQGTQKLRRNMPNQKEDTFELRQQQRTGNECQTLESCSLINYSSTRERQKRTEILLLILLLLLITIIIIIEPINNDHLIAANCIFFLHLSRDTCKLFNVNYLVEVLIACLLSSISCKTSWCHLNIEKKDRLIHNVLTANITTISCKYNTLPSHR